MSKMCEPLGLVDVIIRRGEIERETRRRFMYGDPSMFCRLGLPIPAKLRTVDFGLWDKLRRAEVDVDNARDANYSRQTGGLIRLGLLNTSFVSRKWS